MIKLTENVQIKLSKNEVKYLNIIKERYKYKRSQFIRDAIREKMERDVPKMRINLAKELEFKVPF